MKAKKSLIKVKNLPLNLRTIVWIDKLKSEETIVQLFFFEGGLTLSLLHKKNITYSNHRYIILLGNWDQSWCEVFNQWSTYLSLQYGSKAWWCLWNLVLQQQPHNDMVIVIFIVIYLWFMYSVHATLSWVLSCAMITRTQL